MQAPLRVALVGVAHVHVSDHLEVIAGDPALVLAAGWDAVPERLSVLPDAVRTGDAAEAAARADLVVIDSTTAAHRELVPLVTTMGKPVFVEKPLGRNLAETVELAACIDDAGVPFATGLFLRCLPALRRVRTLIAEGALGELVAVHARFAHPGLLDGWFTGSASWMLQHGEAGMGGFGDLATHLLDVLLWLRPTKALRVRHAVLSYASPPGVESYGAALLSWDDVVPVTVHAGWTARPGGLQLTIEGTAGSVAIDGGTLATTIDDHERRWRGGPPDARSPLVAFISQLRGRATWDPPSTQQAVQVAELLDAAYRGAGVDW